jgi:hypothetical protein
MAAQLSVAVRNARLDAIETTIGTAPTLEIRTGAQPANCAAADSGTLLASMTLPSSWMNAASGGTMTLSGTWEDLIPNNAGTAGHFRIKQGATCGLQGSVTATGGGGDIELSSVSITTTAVTITAFTITDANS